MELTSYDIFIRLVELENENFIEDETLIVQDFFEIYNSSKWDDVTLEVLKRFQFELMELRTGQVLREITLTFTENAEWMIEAWSWITPTLETLEQFEDFAIFNCTSKDSF